MLDDIKEAIKQNLSGTFRWSKYLKYGKHDRKFGPNKLDFVIQMPIVGLLAYFFVLALIYLIMGITKPLFLVYDKVNDNERKKKSNCKSSSHTSV